MLDATHTDTVVHVIVVHTQWLELGLKLRRLEVLSVELAFALEAEILSPRNSARELRAENFHRVSNLLRQSRGEEHCTSIVVSGGGQPLVNLKTTPLGRAVWLARLFLKGLTF